MSSTALSTATVLNAGLVGGSVATAMASPCLQVSIFDPRAQTPGTFASGVVTFFADGVPIGQAPIVVSPIGLQQIWRGRAVATLTTFAADAFNHPLTAVYQGDAAFADSASDSVIQAGTAMSTWCASACSPAASPRPSSPSRQARST